MYSASERVYSKEGGGGGEERKKETQRLLRK